MKCVVFYDIILYNTCIMNQTFKNSNLLKFSKYKKTTKFGPKKFPADTRGGMEGDRSGILVF